MHEPVCTRNLKPFATAFKGPKPGAKRFIAREGGYHVPENCIYPKAKAVNGENSFIAQQLASGILHPSWVAWFDEDEATQIKMEL